jgi:hypothetical protein
VKGELPTSERINNYQPNGEDYYRMRERKLRFEGNKPKEGKKNKGEEERNDDIE